VLPFALKRVIAPSNPGFFHLWKLNTRFCRMLTFAFKKEKTFKKASGTSKSIDIITIEIKQYPKIIFNKHNAGYLVYLISFITVMLMVIVLPSTMSRASWLGGIAAAGFLIWRSEQFNQHKSKILARLSRRLVCVLLFVFLVTGAAGVYLLKKDSASGRLLIWKITLKESLNRPLTGHGFNAFMADFPPAQARYFQQGKGNEYEKYIAGNVKWTFNEPLQLLFEQGLVGLGLFMLVLWLAFSNKHAGKKDCDSTDGRSKPFSALKLQGGQRDHGTQNIARASIAGIMVFALFSYPFYSVPVSVIFAVSLGSAGAFLKPARFPKSIFKRFQTRSLAEKGKQIFAKSTLIILVAGIVLYSILIAPKLYKSYWLWDEAKALYRMGSYREANNSFQQAYHVYLKHHGIFLLNYGKSLYLAGQYKESLEILKQARNYYTDEVYFTTLGDTYNALGDHRQAEQAYKTAANMVPHKFYPLYLLARLYDETGQNTKAKQTARNILNKEVKVHSTAIEEMKTEMEELIVKYGK